MRYIYIYRISGSTKQPCVTDMIANDDPEIDNRIQMILHMSYKYVLEIQVVARRGPYMWWFSLQGNLITGLANNARNFRCCSYADLSKK